MTDRPGIPEPSRPVRWRAAAAHWWLFGLGIGMSWVILTVVGALLWAMSGGGLPFDDRTLDAGAEETEADVTATTPTSIDIGDRPLAAYRYVFDLGDGQRRFGTCYAPVGRFLPGRRYELEYLSEDPDVHRLRDSKRRAVSYWLIWYVGWLWLPLLLLLLYWLRGVFRLRALLRDGQLANAELESSKRMVGVNPRHLRVRYAFVDRHGQRHTGSHWVRVKSALGRAVSDALAGNADAPSIHVVYGELRPSLSRLVTAADFRSGTDAETEGLRA